MYMLGWKKSLPHYCGIKTLNKINQEKNKERFQGIPTVSIDISNPVLLISPLMTKEDTKKSL